MGSNNYAERITTVKEDEQILADLKKVKLFHLEVTERDKDYWGKGGMDLVQLECSMSTVDSYAAQGLFETSDCCYEVNFGNGYYGWCFQIHHKYVWLAPVRESHEAYKIVHKMSETIRDESNSTLNDMEGL